jgi:hypothetical protein
VVYRTTATDLGDTVMTLDEILRDLHALREDLLVFERKYNMPTEVFFQAYSNGEEPADTAWVLDWSEWAASYELLEERLAQYRSGVTRLLKDAQVSSLSQLMERTARHEPVAVPA